MRVGNVDMRPELVFVNHEVEIGGAEAALLRMASAVGDRFRVRVVLPREGPLAEALRRQDVPVRLLALPEASLAARRGPSVRLLLSLLGETPAWVRALRVLSADLRTADLVVTGSTKAHLYGGLAGRLARRPVVWWLHDTVDRTSFGFLSRGAVRAGARLLPRGIVAVSRAAAGSLGLPEGDPRVRVVHNGVAVETRVRERGLHAPTVGWVGRLVPSKGPDLFLRAAGIVARAEPSARFVLVGSVDERWAALPDVLRRTASEEGLDGRLELSGYRADLGPVYATLDVLAFTSTASDSLPTVILEAMAAGVPVVAFSGGGVGELVEEGRTGFLVARGAVEEMAERVVRLLREEGLRREMGRRAHAAARERFALDAWTRDWEDAVSRWVGEGRPS